MEKLGLRKEVASLEMNLPRGHSLGASHAPSIAGTSHVNSEGEVAPLLATTFVAASMIAGSVVLCHCYIPFSA